MSKNFYKSILSKEEQGIAVHMYAIIINDLILIEASNEVMHSPPGGYDFATITFDRSSFKEVASLVELREIIDMFLNNSETYEKEK